MFLESCLSAPASFIIINTHSLSLFLPFFLFLSNQAQRQQLTTNTMGRAPCCDKANVKKGPWSPEEDAKLKSYIEQHGTGGNWIALPQKIGLKRCGKSCRLRWLNYLRPNLRHGGFSEEEDNIICSLYISIGSRWSVIAAQLPGRTDNDIKNYWNTKLKKKLLGKQRKEQQHARNKGIKQENQYSSSSLVLQGSNNSIQQPYCWPQFPYTNQLAPGFNDQDSIKKLLIKLGGRFSDDYYQEPVVDGLNNLQFPEGLPSTQPVHEEQVHIVGSSGGYNMSSDNNNNELVQGSFIAGEGSFTELLGEMESIEHYQQRLSGISEFFYGEGMSMINDDKIMGSSSCSQSTNWGETSSTLIYPPTPSLVASNYHESSPQECAFQELNYPEAQ